MDIDPPAALRIRIEHRRLASTMRALRRAAAAAPHTDKPDFSLLHSLMATLQGTEAARHLAFKEQRLFPLVVSRCPALAPVVQRLLGERRSVEVLGRELSQALSVWEAAHEFSHERFRQLLRRYSDALTSQMKVEENYVLGVAQDYLSRMDWQQLEATWARVEC